MHQPREGILCLSKARRQKWGGGNRPEKWNNDRRKKSKHSKRAATDERKTQLQFTRRTRGSFSLLNCDWWFDFCLLLARGDSYDTSTLPCSRIYSSTLANITSKTTSDIREYNISFSSGVVFNLWHHCIITTGESIEVSREIIFLQLFES